MWPRMDGFDEELNDFYSSALPKGDNKLLVSSSVVNATSDFPPLCPISIRTFSHVVALVCRRVFQI
jgi:hypothetical protein